MSDCLDDGLCEFTLQEVVGDRVLLRPLVDADVQPLFELIEGSREFLSVHLPWPAEECFTPEDVASKIDAWDLQAQMANGACWGVFEKASQKIAGCIMLGWVQWKNRSATVAAVARRAGFAEEGICREYERLHGRFEDHVRFSLLAKDF